MVVKVAEPPLEMYWLPLVLIVVLMALPSLEICWVPALIVVEVAVPPLEMS
jgi:hypothetical protein